MTINLSAIQANRKVSRAYEDDAGLWAELKQGWRCIYSGAHACREETLSDLAIAVKDAEPCECSDCVEY